MYNVFGHLKHVLNVIPDLFECIDAYTPSGDETIYDTFDAGDFKISITRTGNEVRWCIKCQNGHLSVKLTDDKWNTVSVFSSMISASCGADFAEQIEQIRINIPCVSGMNLADSNVDFKIPLLEEQYFQQSTVHSLPDIEDINFFLQSLTDNSEVQRTNLTVIDLIMCDISQLDLSKVAAIMRGIKENK